MQVRYSPNRTQLSFLGLPPTYDNTKTSKCAKVKQRAELHDNQLSHRFQTQRIRLESRLRQSGFILYKEVLFSIACLHRLKE